MNNVCVLIPHYNSPSDLLNTVESIDSNEKVDLLIVDDGSVYKPIEEEINNSFKANGKIIYIYLPLNLGIEAALNKGLEYILEQKYLYIARIDAGDLALAGRFAKQENILHTTDYAIVGTSCDVIDLEGNRLYTINPPKDFDEIRNKMYYNVMFIHPTVMFKSCIIETVGMYPYNYKAAEDYAFFFRIIKKYRGTNIQEVLTVKKFSPLSISNVKRRQQQISKIRVIKDNFYLGFYPIVGMIRNIIILLIPYKIVTFIKKHLNSGY